MNFYISLSNEKFKKTNYILMVFFLPILGWSFLESLGQSIGLDHRTCTERVIRQGCAGRPSDG